MAAYPDEKNPATIKEKEIPSNGVYFVNAI
jgi:hypothetical protein